jgi:hypothetical protein
VTPPHGHQITNTATIWASLYSSLPEEQSTTAPRSTYMAHHPISNGLVLTDVEEDGSGGDSNIELEDGKESKQAAVEAIEEEF